MKYYLYKLMKANKIMVFNYTDMHQSIIGIKNKYENMDIEFDGVKKISRMVGKDTVELLLKQKLKTYAYGHHGKLPKYNASVEIIETCNNDVFRLTQNQIMAIMEDAYSTGYEDHQNEQPKNIDQYHWEILCEE